MTAAFGTAQLCRKPGQKQLKRILPDPVNSNFIRAWEQSAFKLRANGFDGMLAEFIHNSMPPAI
jgi:hypothetical protein